MKSIFPVIASLALFAGACAPAPASATAVATAASTQTPAASPTPLPAIAHVGGSVPCFADAHIDADVLTTVEIGDHLEIVGQARARKFWVVQPEEIEGLCWIESAYVTVDGDTNGISHLVPTLLPPPPSPSGFAGEVVCIEPGPPYYPDVHDTVFVNLQWDPVDSADGYSIYRNDELVVELPSDTTTYSLLIVIRNNPIMRGKANVEITAFNEFGTSEPSTLLVDYICSF